MEIKELSTEVAALIAELKDGTSVDQGPLSRKIIFYLESMLPARKALEAALDDNRVYEQLDLMKNCDMQALAASNPQAKKYKYEMDLLAQQQGEIEAEITRLRKENEFLRTCGVVELSIRNPNVKSWMHEMEGRVNEARGQAEARKILLEQVRRDTLNKVLASVNKHSNTARAQLEKISPFCIDQDIWSAIVSHLDLVFESVAKMRESGPTLPETASSWPTPAAKPGPVAEVTRREVISGRYGRVFISKGPLTAPREVGIRLFGQGGWATDVTVLNASEVLEMRDVLDAILPVLEAE